MRRLAAGAVFVLRAALAAVLPPTTCKYHPSCSHYARDAIVEYGILRGSVLAGWRLLRCHPWAAGGVDYPKDQKLFGRRRAQRKAA